MAIATSRPHNPTMKQTAFLLHNMDLFGAAGVLKIELSISEAHEDRDYFRKLEAKIGEAWEIEA